MSSAPPLPVDVPVVASPFHMPLDAHEEAALAAANRNVGLLLVAAGIWDQRTYERLLCQPCSDADLLTE